MLLRLLAPPLENVSGYKVYSVALVKGRVTANTYTVGYEDAECKIHTQKILGAGKWIRFHGHYDGELIVCDFVEVLDGIDVGLLIKCIKRMN